MKVAFRGIDSTLETDLVRERAAARCRVLSAGVDFEGSIERYRRVSEGIGRYRNESKGLNSDKRLTNDSSK